MYINQNNKRSTNVDNISLKLCSRVLKTKQSILLWSQSNANIRIYLLYIISIPSPDLNYLNFDHFFFNETVTKFLFKKSARRRSSREDINLMKKLPQKISVFNRSKILKWMHQFLDWGDGNHSSVEYKLSQNYSGMLQKDQHSCQSVLSRIVKLLIF